MLALFIATILLTIAGMVLMLGMSLRDEPLLGAVALMALRIAGTTAAGYGVLHSAG